MNETPTTVQAKVTIISIWSIWSKIDGLEGQLRGRGNNVTYEVEVPAGSNPTETLERAFCLTSADDRSTAGDIMVLDGQHYLIEPNGYHALTLEESVVIQKLTSRRTSFGYDWLAKMNLLPMTEKVALNILGQVRAKIGRNYKSHIRDAWMNGHYDYYWVYEWETTLQQIRYVFGPSWLITARPPKV